ncbi:hypothetical protein PKF023_16870 [Polynucleobacter yangtzensis]|uniref:Uncharacterized protein n=1 Tax=Polynucleobacter yangtzensis TaxID=1743159 RepID=A0A9C7CWG7_9BURK|nr:hypothetical protein PKF023_16870 [Polynucleobacter yangtzensis]
MACCERGGKGRLAKLYKDFGDVREDNFKKWWTEGGRGATLFSENVPELTLRELSDKSQWDEAWTADEVLVVAIPLTSSRRYIQSRLIRLLDKRHHAEKPGRKKSNLAQSTASYPLERNYTIENLQKTLQVYDKYLQVKDEKPKVPLWKIGEQMRLVRTAMTSDDISLNEQQDRRNVMGASVKRYIANAEKLIANTAKGRFPLTKK